MLGPALSRRDLNATQMIGGSCHCGRLTIEFSTVRDLGTIPPRACQCGFCRKHGAAYLSDPDGRITLTIQGSAEDIYRFGLGITDFHVCGSCGVLVAATWADGAGGTFGVVNLRALDHIGDVIATPMNANFEGEDVAQREARRRANWTPTLVVTNGN